MDLAAALSSTADIDWPRLGLVLLVLVTVGVLIASSRRAAVASRHGLLLAFTGFFVLPIAVTGLGTAAHLRQATSTEFCVSCHVMEPYGASLLFEDSSYLPAVHFQNALVPREHACYACHTNYTMFGDVKSKLAGLEHVYVYYLGTMPETIELYEPYRNRECLSCHGAARSFREGELHAGLLEDLESETTSCLDCHASVHAVADLESEARWSADDPLVQTLAGGGAP